MLRGCGGSGGGWRRGRAVASAGLVLALAATMQAQGDALGRRVAALLADPAAARAHWGIAVMAMDGTPLYALNAEQLFRPASTAKLFTTAAAMALLGPQARFSTRLTAEGTVEHGVLHGDLVLVGGGDANFASGYALPYRAPAATAASGQPKGPALAAIDEMVGEAIDNGHLRVAFGAAAGAALGTEDLRVIEGDVVGDDTAFERARYPDGWSVEDLLWGYGAPVSALTIHDNEIDVAIAPAAGTGAATITLTPELPYYRVTPALAVGVETTAVRTAAMAGAGVQFERAPGSHDLLVTGAVAAGSGAVQEEVAIEEPAEYAAMALLAALERRGVEVRGRVRVRHRALGAAGCASGGTGGGTGAGTGGSTVLTEAVSAPLAEDVVRTMKESENLHAEVMLRNLAGVCGATLAASTERVRQFLLQAGIAGGDVVLYDGSGLSTKDLVTPRATAQLLAYAARQSWFATWRAALPVGGVDGTLAHRFQSAPLRGHVVAKTGTLRESRALAGYVDAASGRTVIFAIAEDDHAPGAADRGVMDAVVGEIAAAF